MIVHNTDEWCCTCGHSFGDHGGGDCIYCSCRAFARDVAIVPGNWSRPVETNAVQWGRCADGVRTDCGRLEVHADGTVSIEVEDSFYSGSLDRETAAGLLRALQHHHERARRLCGPDAYCNSLRAGGVLGPLCPSCAEVSTAVARWSADIIGGSL